MMHSGLKHAAIALLMTVLLYSTTQFRLESSRITAKRNEAERSRSAMIAAREALRRELGKTSSGLPRGKAIRAKRRASELLFKVTNDVVVAFDDDDDGYESDPVDASDEVAIAVDTDAFPILPINRRKLAAKSGTSGPEAVVDVLPGLFSMSAQTRKIDETKLPHKCGAIIYDHHIPGEGGVSLNDWIKKLVESHDGSFFVSSEEHTSKESYLNEVDQKIQGIGHNDWLIIHSHRNGLTFATDEETLLSWREIAERGNCHFIAAAIFSDPLDHSIKQTSDRFTECDCSVVEFYDTISEVHNNLVTYEPLMSNPWTGQLDHFLSYSDSDTPMDTKDKIKMAMRVLKEHFDIVMVEGKGDFSEELVKITGWSAENRVKGAFVSDKDGLVYAKELVSAFGKISGKNGDADFIDAVNHVYHGSLSFLMMQ